MTMAKGMKSIGRKTGSKNLTREDAIKAVSLYWQFGTYSKPAEVLGLPYMTCKDLVDRNKDKPEFLTLRDKKDEFLIEKSTEIMNKTLEQLEQKITNGEVTGAQLATIYGIMYDKRALSKGEATANNNFNVNIKVVK